MGKVKTFFLVFINSAFPHHPYYHKLLKTSFVHSVRYFLILIAILYFAFLFFFTIKNPAVLRVQKVIQSLSKSLQSFPQSLVITIRNGRLSTNLEHPYFMWFDYEGKKMILLVVDHMVSGNTIPSYKPIMYATQSTFAVRNLKNVEGYQLLSLKGITAQIDKAVITEIQKNVQMVLQSWTFFVIAAAVIGLPIILVMVNILYLLIASIIAFTIGKLFLPALSFKKTLQLGMHAITIPLIINYTLGLVNVKLILLPATYLVLLTFFTGAAVYEAYWNKLPHHK